MCDRRAARAAPLPRASLRPLLALLCLAALPARAEPAAPKVEPVALPFAVTAMRGPGSEVALAVATSGLLPVARAPAGAAADPKATASAGPVPVVVVWGEGGGAVLSRDGGALRTTLIGAEAVEGFAAAETPRGAVPGGRRAQDGPVSAYLTGPTRALGGAPGQAAGLTIRERQPMGVTAEPKPVPVATTTLAPGPDRVFAGRTPRIGAVAGRPAVLAVTAFGAAGSGLALAAKDGRGAWALAAQTPPQPGRAPEGAPLALAGLADFLGEGAPQVAAVRAPDGEGVLQVWRYADGALALAAEAPGYAGPAAGEEADLAAILPGPVPEIALPVAGRGALAVLALRGGPRERLRIPLPAPAAFGLAALGGPGGPTLLAGLADGRLVAVTVAQ